MGFFTENFANVVEWLEFRDDMIFWKWNNSEIKRGSRLLIRPGQDAIFLYNGKIEGIFKEEGEYDIESQITPFLSTLKGFKFGFNSGMRAEVLFVNTKEFQAKWGTRNAIPIPHPQMPGGLPIRANGAFTFQVNDYITLIDKIAGLKQSYLVSDVKDRILSILDPLLMKWITKEGKDIFHLNANGIEIAKGIQMDLDMELLSIGMTVKSFHIMSFSYPEAVQKMIEKNASHSMIGNINTYQQVSMIDGMSSGSVPGHTAVSDMAGMMMGMNMANQMMQNITPSGHQPTKSADKSIPNFCPNCGSKTNNGNFCSNCGTKLI